MSRGGSAVGDNFTMTSGVDVHAMWRLLAIRISLSAAARVFRWSRATPLPALCWRPRAAPIWRAAARCFAAAIALLTALSLVSAQDMAQRRVPFEGARQKLVLELSRCRDL